MTELSDRFWTKVDRTGGDDACWPWMGWKYFNGYGGFDAPGPNVRRGKKLRAHRVAYEELIGEIPAGLVIDHLCRNRSCVNPAHMEVVTNKENVLRGVSHSAVNARKTHCVHGHEFTPENTSTWAGRPNKRICRQCRRKPASQPAPFLTTLPIPEKRPLQDIAQ